ncbi:esterase/lipase family protein [Nocardia salmonicida]|uniref:esterase/lipase family protein n=1 Tax=Nocardia salmonicida TaxID=53431 RepID=UPI0033D36F67
MKSLLVAAMVAASSIAVISTASANPAFVDPIPDPTQTTQGTGPVQPSIVRAMAFSLQHPNAAPPGANDWQCKLTPERPRPVVLVHGTWANAYNDWAMVSSTLAARGHCVFALNYGGGDSSSAISHLPGINATNGDLDLSAKQLSAFVDEVLARTGATQVELVGHSQGVVVARQYMRFGGGTDASDAARNKVAGLVSLAGPNSGTTFYGVEQLLSALNKAGVPAGEALAKTLGYSTIPQGTEREFIHALNAGAQTEPGVAYTAISTRYDELVVPYQNSFLTAGPGATVRSFTIQDGCEIDFVGHINMSYDRRTVHYIVQGIERDADLGPAPCDFATQYLVK